MIRMVRRALRQWKREFLAVWGRFTAFHRIVIGILLAMGLVYMARSRLLDPLDRELAGERRNLADKGVPAQVPTPGEDVEIQEERLRAENLKRSLENRSAELAAAEAATRLRLGAGKADASATLLALSGRHGLRVLKNASAEAPVGGTVPAAASVYELAGRFSAIFGFLEDVRREPLAWALRDVSVDLWHGQAAPETAPAPLLLLRFTLVLHLYGGGGS